MMAQAAAPAAKPAPDARAAVVCVRADRAGRRPLTFAGQLVGKRPQPGAFKLPLTPGADVCNNLLRSKIATWTLEVTTSGFTPCTLPPPEFGYRVTYSAKATRGLQCAQIAKSPIGTWK
ncbi:MAG: hypothetical protein B7Z44_02975 [Caulobacter sp. 12-67-6]|nr:MAG: hypothetical protein B7Z44_02975 [Caulobacter sp. 12-67-6]OYX67152.1 MAG: hypothetical protein B7Y81_19405 [Caulobacter sp. 32-67-35]HQR90763.1 hypothetical protein [Caulobacter sp.]